MTDSTPRLEPFTLSLVGPLGTAVGEICERSGFLVGVEVESDGRTVRGLGEATPLPGWTESLDECESALECMPADGWDAPLSGLPAAAHGYHLALLDAEARASKRSLSGLLADRIDAGDPAESVPVNATVGDGTVSETVDAARAAVEDGFDCLKLKVGVGDPAVDQARVEAVVDTVDAAVRVDANGAWDRGTAREQIDAFASLGVEYVEQPLPADDLAGLALLRGRGVDVAVDESLRVVGVERVLEAGVADVAVLKPMALGGPAAAVDLAGHLQGRGVDVVVTTTIDAAIARAAAVHVAAAIPGGRACGLATASLLAEDLGPGPAPIREGHVAVPDGPGNVGDRFDDLVWGE